MRPRLSQAVGALKHLLAPTTRRTPPDTELDRVRISYEPCADDDPDPGEVVWTWVAYQDDPARGKDRPVVVIGRNGALVAAVALTSQQGRRGDTVEIGRGRWDTGGRTSYAKLDRILSVDPAAMRREGAILDRQRFDRLVAALRRRHDIAVDRPR